MTMRRNFMTDRPKRIFKNISISILLYLLISLIVSFAMFSIAYPFAIRTGNIGAVTAFSEIAMLVSMLICWLLVRSFFQSKTEGEIRWKPITPMPAKTMIRYYILGSGGMMILSMIVSLISLLLPRAFSTPDFSPTADPLSNLLLVFTSVIAAPLFEEYLFRGVCMMGLKRYGNGFSILVTSFLFALMHGNIPQAVPIFFFSLILCYADIRTGSLLPGLIFHIVNNAVAQMTLFIAQESVLILLALLMLIVMITAVVLFILELKQKARYRAELIGPYDFHFSAFFNNWASITLLVVLIISMAPNVIASLV